MMPAKARPKLRADQLACDQGLAESRERAKRLIMAGQVLMDLGRGPEPVDKPGRQLSPDTPLSLKQAERFVSRGGHKLLTAIEHFKLDFTDAVALDAGASTGGFTDCLLQHGAARVFAADVGRGQLHERLARDPRVTALDNVNLRHAPPDLLPEPVDVLTLDLSFISARLVLPALVGFLKPGGLAVVLVKPQFELGPEANVKGVVKDEKLRLEAVDMVEDFCVRELGLETRGFVPSAITGPKGNREYLLCLRKPKL